MAQVPKHRDNLVRTAMRLFRRQGFASTGLNQILSESGAPKGSLYHYFPGGKEELGEAAVSLAGRLIGEMLEAARDRFPDKPEAFVQVYASTMAGWMAESDFSSGCPIATTLLETTPHNADIASAGLEAIEAWTGIIASVFQQAGLTRPAATLRARLLICAMEGALILARVQKSREPILQVGRHFGRIEE